MRLTAEQAFRHDWIQGRFNTKVAWLPGMIFSELSTFARANKMKKIALMYIASRLDEQEIPQIRDQFMTIDLDGDGLISQGELQRVMSGFIDLDSDQGKAIIPGLDLNLNGFIDYTEFLSACLHAKNYTNPGLLKSAFNYFDTDNSGFITFDEIKAVLIGHELTQNTDENVEQIMNEVDTNHDGKVDYIEFLNLLSERGIDYYN